ncbi:MAG: hypothetical protein FWE01_02005 [Firmicutes bacterium]|nr:hypothetical protein [Bacillota bacterium]
MKTKRVRLCNVADPNFVTKNLCHKKKSAYIRWRTLYFAIKLYKSKQKTTTYAVVVLPAVRLLET